MYGTTQLCDLPSSATAELEADNRFGSARRSRAERLEWSQEPCRHSTGGYVSGMSSRSLKKPSYPRAHADFNAPLATANEHYYLARGEGRHGIWLRLWEARQRPQNAFGSLDRLPERSQGAVRCRPLTVNRGSRLARKLECRF